jgi:hypothetical protein
MTPDVSTYAHGSGHHTVPFWLAVLVVAAIFTAPAQTQAALGDHVASVEADRSRMQAAAAVRNAPLYTVHELTTPYNTLIREYVAADVVFAVTWQGPYQPDLAQLLGSYVDTYKTAPRSPSSSRTRSSVEQANLIVHITGHMRAFSGIAYDPQLLPAGVSVDEIQ